MPSHERRGWDVLIQKFLLEDMLVVERPGHQRIVPDVGDPQHLQHRGGVRNRVVTLDSARVEPRHVDVFARQGHSEAHVVGNQDHVLESEAAERAGDIFGHRPVALPRPRIAGAMNNRAVVGIVAAIDHGDAHAPAQLVDLPLQLVGPAGAARRNQGRGRRLVRLGTLQRLLKRHDLAPAWFVPLCGNTTNRRVNYLRTVKKT